MTHLEGDGTSSTQFEVDVDPGWDDHIWKYGWVEFMDPDKRIEHRRITASTTDTVTFTPPIFLATAGAKAVDIIRLIQPANQRWYVWKRFVMNNDDTVVNITDPWMAVAGGQFSSNITPTLQAEHLVETVDGGTGVAMRINAGVEIVEDGAAFISTIPLCALVMNPKDLYLTASSIGAPSQVYLTAPKDAGNLAAVYPPDTVVAPPGTNTPDYEGTAYTRFSISKTRHEYLPDWKNDQQQVLFDNLAEAKLAPFKDVRLQGSLDIIDFQSGFALRNVVSSSASRPATLTIEVNENMAPSQSGSPTTTNWDNMLIKSVSYSWQKTGSPAVTTSLNIDNNQRPGRQQDELMFAVKHASTFIELRYDFNATRPTIGQMSIAVDQRIMNPDLVR